MTQISNRWPGAIIASHETQSLADLATATKADLRGADLRGANLSDANLSDADLRGADLRGANLSGANLSDADLRGADLRDADLSGANLSDADLRDADLSDANLSAANLSAADLSDADLSGCKQRVVRIQGSFHEINAINGDVRIGCKRGDISWWLEHFREVGIENGYTDEQITEYGLHLSHIAALVKLPWLGVTVTREVVA